MSLKFFKLIHTYKVTCKFIQLITLCTPDYYRISKSMHYGIRCNEKGHLLVKSVHRMMGLFLLYFTFLFFFIFIFSLLYLL